MDSLLQVRFHMSDSRLIREKTDCVPEFFILYNPSLDNLSIAPSYDYEKNTSIWQNYQKH